MLKKITIFLLTFTLFYGMIGSTMAQDKNVNLVYFGAEWCGPCRTFKANVLPKLKEKFSVGRDKTHDIIILDYDEDRDLAEIYNVKSVPSFFIIKKRKIVRKWVGNIYKAKEIESILKSYRKNE